MPHVAMTILLMCPLTTVAALDRSPLCCFSQTDNDTAPHITCTLLAPLGSQWGLAPEGTTGGVFVDLRIAGTQLRVGSALWNDVLITSPLDCRVRAWDGLERVQVSTLDGQFVVDVGRRRVVMVSQTPATENLRSIAACESDPSGWALYTIPGGTRIVQHALDGEVQVAIETESRPSADMQEFEERIVIPFFNATGLLQGKCSSRGNVQYSEVSHPGFTSAGMLADSVVCHNDSVVRIGDVEWSVPRNTVNDSDWPIDRVWITRPWAGVQAVAVQRRDTLYILSASGGLVATLTTIGDVQDVLCWHESPRTPLSTPMLVRPSRPTVLAIVGNGVQWWHESSGGWQRERSSYIDAELVRAVSPTPLSTLMKGR